MSHTATLRGTTYRFHDLRELLAKANEPKSGDALAGIAAGSVSERAAAKLALADVGVAEILDTPLVDDDVTALIERDLDRDRATELRSLTIGELRELVLSEPFAGRWRAGLRDGLTPELVAAVAKLMSSKDLVAAAAPLEVVTRCRSTVGARGTLAVRAQPNHPTDALDGMVISTLDGLLHGCGDAMIGVNPVNDSVEAVATQMRTLHGLIAELGIPTQACVLAHVTTQLEALRQGAPVDLLFQSIAGTQAANASFGVTLELLADGREEVLAHHLERPGEFLGEQVMYFETGQGSALSAGAHHGVDQLTLEARAYGVARHFDPFLVNTVVGFIGPEYLADARQITRAGLEDHFMGKALGLPMGCDVCHTNHVDADQSSNDELLMLLALAGCAFVIAVPGSDDVMLNYQSVSYRDVAVVRRLLDRAPAPEFEAWLRSLELWDDDGLRAVAEHGLHAARPLLERSLGALPR
ncbi:ethanolamine ammonia-lyase subunit EutB [Conexibacter stalactiti]|uniref:Ethanolamine ammonia-lyase large subunit n=1 Tax=Conexibacter stalactiti TaxID=1940611 RepID=A0ABU4HJF1_9ACTN|nr:ethanolamine ammonia-lyase subunit EutB [Conexibacter stalactiti]MDW5593439.1 ethanolamine ammonia-lyase subunit EutB [Conexibacter stalactiti]MEC5034080.1 ethanolamine ammonia-lyase subunit EutB [Conexibacter stalactiti]